MLDAIKLLRIPFSVFLMPIYWLALLYFNDIEWDRAIHLFILIHFFIYPASNGYNCYFDRDEKSIGGLKNPPKVNKFLFPLVVLFDLLALAYAVFIQANLVFFVAGYLLVSKAYSHPKIRLKKFPLISTAVVAIFQGSFMFFSVQYGVQGNFSDLFTADNLLLAFCSTIFLLASYPLTQVYQHEEDRNRGDQTLSLVLGIKGTFYWAGVFFFLGLGLLSFWILQHYTVNEFLIFLIIGSPVLLYFGHWFKQVLQNPGNANFEYSMKMNIISALSLSLGLIYLLFLG